MVDANKTKISPRRSMIERVKEIFNFIDKQDRAFPKSKLKEIGLNPSSAENWLKMIEYIQNQPRIRLISSEKNILVEKVEGKYQAMIRRVILNDKLSLEERDVLLRNYLPSLFTREILEIDRKKSVIEIEFPKSMDELINFVKDKEIQISDLNNHEELLIAVRNWFIENGLI